MVVISTTLDPLHTMAGPSRPLQVKTLASVEKGLEEGRPSTDNQFHTQKTQHMTDAL